MAKINITGVLQGEGQYIIDILLTKKGEVEGELQDISLGSGRITLRDNTKPSKVKAEIIKAAQGIMAKNREAQSKTKSLQQVEFPEIEE